MIIWVQGFETPTAVLLRIQLFWGVMQSIWVSVSRRFGGTSYLYLMPFSSTVEGYKKNNH
jgi:hypothetical protein